MSERVQEKSSFSSNPQSYSSTTGSLLQTPLTYTCANCEEVISGLIVKAMGRTWHPNHFICAHCQSPITSLKYHVYDGKPYCDNDYAELFLQKCCACGRAIKDVVVMALGRPWHREHFNCAGCSTTLASKVYYEKDGQAFCDKCFANRFCPFCETCGKPIVEMVVLALGNKYHVNCFRCVQCDEPIMNGHFMFCKDKPFCEACFSI